MQAAALLRGDVIDLDDVVHGLIGVVGEALAGGLSAFAGEDAVGDDAVADRAGVAQVGADCVGVGAIGNAQSFHGQSKQTGICD